MWFLLGRFSPITVSPYLARNKIIAVGSSMSLLGWGMIQRRYFTDSDSSQKKPAPTPLFICAKLSLCLRKCLQFSCLTWVFNFPFVFNIKNEDIRADELFKSLNLSPEKKEHRSPLLLKIILAAKSKKNSSEVCSRCYHSILYYFVML